MNAINTFISVGNALQPFPRLFDLVEAVVDILPEPVFIQHGNTAFINQCFQYADFIDMEAFADKVAEAKVVIIHAGAGSVLHAIRAGKKPIVVPRKSAFSEHVDNHQVEFSQALADQGLIYVANDVNSLKQAALCVLKSNFNKKVPGKNAALVAEIDNILKKLSQLSSHKIIHPNR